MRHSIVCAALYLVLASGCSLFGDKYDVEYVVNYYRPGTAQIRYMGSDHVEKSATLECCGPVNEVEWRSVKEEVEDLWRVWISVWIDDEGETNGEVHHRATASVYVNGKFSNARELYSTLTWDATGPNTTLKY